MSDYDPWPHSVNVGSAVIYREGKFLLIQEKRKRIYGKWNFPGGRQDPDETIEETAVREAKEESGYEVKIIKLLVKIDHDKGSRTLNAFLAEIVGGDLKIQEEEIMDAGWFTYDEIVAMKSELRDAEYILSALEQTA